MKSSFASLLVWVGLSLFSSGCAIVINAPVARFDSPETQGAPGKGFIAISAGGDSDLIVIPDTTANPPQDSRSFARTGELSESLGLGILDNLDVEFRNSNAFLMGTAPLMMRAKYQFLGSHRIEKKEGWALASTLGLGTASLSHIDTSTLSETTATTEGRLWAVDLGAIGGYRLTSWYLLYGGPFLTWYTFSGDITLSGTLPGFGPSAGPTSFGGRELQGGVNLGMEFDLAFLLIKLEGAYSGAKSGPASTSGFTAGTLLGIQW